MTKRRARPGRTLEDAQELVYRAWDAATKRKRLALAKEALALTVDCADAWVLLAEEETASDVAARPFWEEAVNAGERVLGRRAFEDDVGHFWGLLETRPYMRAMQGLATCLWRLGDFDAAVGRFEELLRLNPNDNQGNRYLLVACLLEAGRREALTSLLVRYERDWTAVWAWTGALLEFRSSGDSAKSRKALLAAKKQNPHVAPLLLGRRKLPRRLPEYIGFGDESEAVAYAADHRANWSRAPGAVEWLATMEEGALAGPSLPSRSVGRSGRKRK
jgi:tetratricopeptide (TPR) repeat protein